MTSASRQIAILAHKIGRSKKVIIRWAFPLQKILNPITTGYLPARNGEDSVREDDLTKYPKLKCIRSQVDRSRVAYECFRGFSGVTSQGNRRALECGCCICATYAVVRCDTRFLENLKAVLWQPNNNNQIEVCVNRMKTFKMVLMTPFFMIESTDPQSRSEFATNLRRRHTI